MFDREEYFNRGFLLEPPEDHSRNHGLLLADGIYMGESACLQLAHISGWLNGLKASGSKEASRFADKALADLKQAFAVYRQESSESEKAIVDLYGNIYDPGKEFEKAFYGGGIYYPKRLVHYESDFAFASFSFALLELTSEETGPRRKIDQANYRVLINGGLIYHGPGSGETFSVRVGNTKKLWSYHS